MNHRQVVLVLLFIYWICASTCQPQASSGPCGSWISLSESCFLFSDFTASWGEALAICKAFDANLIAIESSDKNFLLEGYLQNKHPHGADYWTGGNDIEKERSFNWIGSHHPFAFTNWMTGQPDVSEQDCVEIRGISNFKWHDDNCNHQHLFICEKPLGGSPEIIG
ncbi:CD209 antigen-like protein C isoform X2 [Magallana gigas]|uniref:CD209 antigen-like protein C isoform X2 n=1 Tax=Magallana gigas TaxID=29159 RepID=UPI00148A9BE1|nr:perlucin-like protein isoform X2 [Crassostrea gigas]